MRIAYLVTTLAVGGAERQVVALARGMVARGHSVVILVVKPILPGEIEPGQGIELFSLGIARNPASILLGALRGARWLHRWQPDLLHAHTFPANMIARMIRLTRLKMPLVGTIHNVYEGGWLRMLAYRLTDRLASRMTTVSTAAREAFLKLRAIRAENSEVTVNGIDCNEFQRIPGRREQVRKQAGVGDRFLWLAAGRIAAAKDYPLLLESFARLLESHPGSLLWIAGAARPEDAALESDLRQRTTETGLDEKVCWLGARSDLPALMDAADGFVLSSAWEGLPLVVAEAMAMELPVVATNVGGVAELLGDCGWLIPPHDAESLAAGMCEVSDFVQRESYDLRAEAARRSGQSSRARVLANFEIGLRVAWWESYYRRLLAACDRSVSVQSKAP